MFTQADKCLQFLWIITEKKENTLNLLVENIYIYSYYIKNGIKVKEEQCFKKFSWKCQIELIIEICFVITFTVHFII